MKVGSVKPEDKRSVISTIDEMKNEIVDLCSKVIQVNSVNPELPGVVRDEVIGGETKCNQLLADTLGRWGFKTDLWEALPQRHNLVATLKGSGT